MPVHPDNPHLLNDRPVSPTWRPKMSKDPDYLLSLQLIPPHLLRAIPKERRPGPVSSSQRSAIRTMLNLKSGQVMKRCRGTRNDGERCGQVAGEGTKGDFYGLGAETGTLGVGFCANCISHHHILPGIALKNARNEVAKMQQYGAQDDDPKYSQELAKREVAVAESNIKRRKELDMMDDTLEKFLRELEVGERDQTAIAQRLQELVDLVKESGIDDAQDLLERLNDALEAECGLTRYAGTKLVRMSYQDIIDAKIRIASSITRGAVEATKLDESKYILVDHVKVVHQELLQASERAMRMVEELTIQKNIQGEAVECGEVPVVDYVEDIMKNEWVAALKRMNTKIGRG